jgi:uncharacterized protein YeeX (DUF496 family)
MIIAFINGSIGYFLIYKKLKMIDSIILWKIIFYPPIVTYLYILISIFFSDTIHLAGSDLFDLVDVEALRENLAEQMSDFNKENDELEERGNEVVKQLESITDRIEITGKNGNRIFKDMPDEELDSKLDEITAKASEISKDAEKLSKKLSAI